MTLIIMAGTSYLGGMLNDEITLIVPHYGEGRVKNLKKICAEYKNKIIWNNGGATMTDAINANKNYGVLVRWLTALLAPTEYVLMNDNDIYIPQETAQKMLNKIKSNPTAIVGVVGVNLGQDHKYTTGTKFESKYMAVDIVVGEAMMMSKKIIPKILETMINLDWWNTDDCIASLVNKNNWIVAGEFERLDEGGSGLYLNDKHYLKRDAICQSFF